LSQWKTWIVDVALAVESNYTMGPSVIHFSCYQTSLLKLPLYTTFTVIHFHEFINNIITQVKCQHNAQTDYIQNRLQGVSRLFYN